MSVPVYYGGQGGQPSRRPMSGGANKFFYQTKMFAHTGLKPCRRLCTAADNSRFLIGTNRPISLCTGHNVFREHADE